MLFINPLLYTVLFWGDCLLTFSAKPLQERELLICLRGPAEFGLLLFLQITAEVGLLLLFLQSPSELGLPPFFQRPAEVG